jgi:hypothetical protein
MVGPSCRSAAQERCEMPFRSAAEKAAALAREILRELEEQAQGAYVSPYHFAYVYAGLGDTDRAMDWLERAVAQRTGPAYGIKGSFLLIPLHAHPRFQALLQQMKLA